jgi:hypothetical protein
MIVLRTGSSPFASAKSRYDSGYADGSAETYNTLCKNRAITERPFAFDALLILTSS